MIEIRYLSNCDIEKLPLVWPSSLKTLDMTNDNLTTIPKYLPANLKSLNFNENDLSNNSSSLTYLPPSLARLSLQYCQLQELKNLDWRAMQYLFLGFNPELTTINNVRLNSTNLKTFWCESCNLSSFLMDADTFDALDSLSPLSIQHDTFDLVTQDNLYGFGLNNSIVDSSEAECDLHRAKRTKLWAKHYSVTNSSYFVCVLPRIDVQYSNLWSVIGIAVTSSALVALIILFLCLWRRSRRLEQESRDAPEELNELNMADLAMVKLDEKGLELQEVIGTGAFADVWLGKYKGQPVAVKILIPGKITIAATQSFIDEIKLLSTFDSKYIVKCYGAMWSRPSDLKCVMEYMPLGDLRDYLARTNEATLPWAIKVSYMEQIVQGLIYLHSFPIVHRDLKSRNIILDESGGAKLTDFGIAKEEEDTMTMGVGTFRWMAPEVLNGTDYSVAADIFSFELSTHHIPYKDLTHPTTGQPLSDTAIICRVVEGNLLPSFTPSCPLWIRDLALSCLAYNPSHRPTAIELYNTIQSQAYSALQAQYIIRRLYGLWKVHNASGIVQGYQILVDIYHKMQGKAQCFTRQLKKSLVRLIGCTLNSFNIINHATLHYLAIVLLRELIAYHNDVREYAKAIDVISGVRRVLDGTSTLTTYYKLLVQIDVILSTTLEHGSMELTGNSIVPAFDIYAIASKSANELFSLQLSKQTNENNEEDIAPKGLIPLPANSRNITIYNWKPKLRFAFQCLECDSKVHTYEAIKIFRAIVALRPTDCDVANVLLNLGAVLMVEGDLDESIKCFESSLKLNPQPWKTWYNLGIALLRQGRLLEGKYNLQKALELNPSHASSMEIVKEINSALTIAAMENVASSADRQAFANELSLVIKSMRAHQTSSVVPDQSELVRYQAAENYAEEASSIAVPVTQALSHGWDKVIAALLHRLYVFATLRRKVVMELFQQACDPVHQELISLESIKDIVISITGKSLTIDETHEMVTLFPQRVVIYALLHPNTETLEVLVDIKRYGASYSNLTYQHNFEHRVSRWSVWRDLPMKRWLNSIPSLKVNATTINDVLVDMGLFSVLHLARLQPKLKPLDFKALNLSERGTLIYELFELRKAIESTAGTMIQDKIRMLVAKAHKRQRLELQQCAKEDRNAHDRTLSRALESALRRQESIWAVTHVLDSILDDAFIVVFAIPPLPSILPCIPIRTELRQRLNLAAASIQQLHRHPQP
ncbi:kinase [Thraustotheca clavata]|uniref:Kinase n=1 Tax=Thraustotheca clavata TaxID=74557 RepID=A0A1V9ZW38_9STRA|nr:kinase [Thraustotheca clavata]